MEEDDFARDNTCIKMEDVKVEMKSEWGEEEADENKGGRVLIKEEDEDTMDEFVVTDSWDIEDDTSHSLCDGHSSDGADYKGTSYQIDEPLKASVKLGETVAANHDFGKTTEAHKTTSLKNAGRKRKKKEAQKWKKMKRMPRRDIMDAFDKELSDYFGNRKANDTQKDGAQKLRATKSEFEISSDKMIYVATNCKVCGLYLPSKKDYNDHRVSNHSNIAHTLKEQCLKCDKRFLTKRLLVDHVLNDHTTDVPVKCSVCDKTCVSEQGLYAHTIAKHDPPKVEECALCRRVFPNEEASYSHMVTKHFKKAAGNAECSICSIFTCRGLMRLANHMVNAHQLTYPALSVPTKLPNSDNFTIMVNQDEYANSKSMKKFASVARAINPGEMYGCKASCGEQFTSLKELRRHKHLHHQQTECMTKLH